MCFGAAETIKDLNRMKLILIKKKNTFVDLKAVDQEKTGKKIHVEDSS